MRIRDRPIFEHMDIFHEEELDRVMSSPWVVIGPGYTEKAYELSIKRLESYRDREDEINGEIPNKVDMAQGIIGELAAGFIFNWDISPSLEVINGADPGYDFDTEYGTVNVKSSRWRRPYLLVDDRKKYQADIYILTHVGYNIEDNGVYALVRVLGFADKMKVANSPASAWPGDNMNRIMFWLELDPVSELGDTFSGTT